MQSLKFKKELESYTLDQLEILNSSVSFPLYPSWVFETIADELHKRYKQQGV